MTDKLKKLESLINLVDESLTRDEFVEAFEGIIAAISDLKKMNQEHLKHLADVCDDLKDKLAGENSADFQEYKKLISDLGKELQKNNTTSFEKLNFKLEAKFAKISKEQEDGMNFIRDKARGLKGGKDADESKIIDNVLAKIKLPQIDTLIIDELKETLSTKTRELEEKIVAIPRRIMAGRQLRMAEFQFTGNGSTTTFTLPKEPHAKGKAIWVFYNGQYIHLGTHFTIARKTLTTTFTPENGTTLEGYLFTY